MAGFGLRLMQILTARQRKIRQKQRAFNDYNSRYKQQEVLQVSQKAYKSQRGIQRRLEANFGSSGLDNSGKPQLSFNWFLEASSISRVAYSSSPSGYAIQLTFASGLISDVGIRPNDVVNFRSGALKDYELLVLAVGSTTVTCSDVAGFTTGGTEQQTSITTVADSSGSLNDTYFKIYSAQNVVEYVVWNNVNGAGTAPSVPGATDVEVVLATNSSADTVATAVAAALNAISGTPFSAVASTDSITVTNNTAGLSTDASDVSTGFSISTPTPGVNPTQSDVFVRALLCTQVAAFNQQSTVEQA